MFWELLPENYITWLYSRTTLFLSLEKLCRPSIQTSMESQNLSVFSQQGRLILRLLRKSWQYSLLSIKTLTCTYRNCTVLCCCKSDTDSSSCTEPEMYLQGFPKKEIFIFLHGKKYWPRYSTQWWKLKKKEKKWNGSFKIFGKQASCFGKPCTLTTFSYLPSTDHNCCCKWWTTTSKPVQLSDLAVPWLGQLVVGRPEKLPHS